MSRNVSYEKQYDPPPLGWEVSNYLHNLRSDDNRAARHLLIACIMGVALFAFEVFNYDTTRYALTNLIGDISFMNFTWAGILAVAFCSIDFAGLIRLFTPEMEEPTRESWYLMGAWLLGATMNAMMTWWAVSLTLLDHTFGNEILSRDVLLRVVPVFVAVLVWLTRILFIGAITYSTEMVRKQIARSKGEPVATAKRQARPARRRRAAPISARRTRERRRAQVEAEATLSDSGRHEARIVEKPVDVKRRKAGEQRASQRTSLTIDEEPIWTEPESYEPPEPLVTKRVRPKVKPIAQKVAANRKTKSKPRGLVRPKPHQS